MSRSLPLRVLIIEDSARIRQSLIEQVKVAGRVDVVQWADTESDALDLLDRHAVDALIVDLRLREGSGFGVLGGIQTPRFGGVKKIVLTNYSSSEMRDRCLALGADYFFDKSREFSCVNAVLAEMATELEAGATGHDGAGTWARRTTDNPPVVPAE
jgi:DNA-binding NarL/FixJ family response regulator